jgi:hypothetical protein
MTPDVEVAVAEIHEAFSGHRVEVEPEGQGGAYVVVHDLPLGDQYVPSTSWMGFLIGFQYPYSDCYPHFVAGTLRRADGRPLGEGFSGLMEWRNRSAIQVSRRSNRLNPATDTALLKLLKVLEWIRSR